MTTTTMTTTISSVRFRLSAEIPSLPVTTDDDDDDDDDDDRDTRGLQAFIADQFGVRLYDVGRPTRLCNPTNKNGEGIRNPDNHLLCYTVKLADGESRRERVRGIFVNDQFGPGRVDPLKERELCVPSTKEHQ